MNQKLVAAFSAVSKHMTLVEAHAKLRELLLDHCDRVPGLKEYSRQRLMKDSNGTVYLEWEWKFGCGASADFGLDCAPSDVNVEILTPEALASAKIEDVAERYIYVQHPKINVGWSSTGRSVRQASVAVDLYEQVVRFAAMIEEMTSDWTIIDIQERTKGEVVESLAKIEAAKAEREKKDRAKAARCEKKAKV
ncbi:MAG: hypothetical protein V2A71_10470 [Candidatus Eisenbacteria bacterium]